ncbi:MULTISPECIES: hypothetical protein, partial [Burkholderia]|uniref:hypothetical protein n=1 Tax=Burkholderia TaxID=32008 RepID=UPI00064EDDF8
NTEILTPPKIAKVAQFHMSPSGLRQTQQHRSTLSNDFIESIHFPDRRYLRIIPRRHSLDIRIDNERARRKWQMYVTERQFN